MLLPILKKTNKTKQNKKQKQNKTKNKKQKEKNKTKKKNLDQSVLCFVVVLAKVWFCSHNITNVFFQLSRYTAGQME